MTQETGENILCDIFWVNWSPEYFLHFVGHKDGDQSEMVSSTAGIFVEICSPDLFFFQSVWIFQSSIKKN